MKDNLFFVLCPKLLIGPSEVRSKLGRPLGIHFSAPGKPSEMFLFAKLSSQQLFLINNTYLTVEKYIHWNKWAVHIPRMLTFHMILILRWLSRSRFQINICKKAVPGFPLTFLQAWIWKNYLSLKVLDRCKTICNKAFVLYQICNLMFNKISKIIKNITIFQQHITLLIELTHYHCNAVVMGGSLGVINLHLNTL